MSKRSRLFWLSFLVGGGVYALLNAGFNYHDGEPFSIGKFLFDFIFFGLLMGFLSRVNQKHSEKKNKA